MSDDYGLPDKDLMKSEFLGGSIPRSKIWLQLIDGLYANTEKAKEIENWHNATQYIYTEIIKFQDNITQQYDQIDIWHSAVSQWQQQVSSDKTEVREKTAIAVASSDSSAHSAKFSEEQALISEANKEKTQASEQKAKISETNSARSEEHTETLASQTLAHRNEVIELEKKVKVSEANSARSEQQAEQYASQSLTNKNESAQSVLKAKTSEDNSASSAAIAKREADRAKEEADSITFREAPMDGKSYVRKNGEWVEVPEQDNEWRPGDIKMFAGREDQIQSGWKICNGVGTTSNGIPVPDLTDRMVIGSGKTYKTGAKGGNTTATTSAAGNHSHAVTISRVGNHSHTLTINESGNHIHSITVNNTTLSESNMPRHLHDSMVFNKGNNEYGGGYSFNGGGTRLFYKTSYAGGSVAHGHSGVSNTTGKHTHTATANSSGEHTHTASCTTTGNHSHTVSTMSPYYALAFIIKL